MFQYPSFFSQRGFSVDERIAWSHIPLPEAVLNGETIDDWFSLSGQQGDGKEGMVNLVLSFAPLDAPPVSYVPMRPAYMAPGQGQFPVENGTVVILSLRLGFDYDDGLRQLISTADIFFRHIVCLFSLALWYRDANFPRFLGLLRICCRLFNFFVSTVFALFYSVCACFTLSLI